MPGLKYKKLHISNCPNIIIANSAYQMMNLLPILYKGMILFIIKLISNLCMLPFDQHSAADCMFCS